MVAKLQKMKEVTVKLRVRKSPTHAKISSNVHARLVKVLDVAITNVRKVVMTMKNVVKVPAKRETAARPQNKNKNVHRKIHLVCHPIAPSSVKTLWRIIAVKRSMKNVLCTNKVTACHIFPYRMLITVVHKKCPTYHQHVYHLSDHFVFQPYQNERLCHAPADPVVAVIPF